ncbi:MAG: glutaredoxin 3 [Vulcanimicrobiota bacterium]
MSRPKVEIYTWQTCPYCWRAKQLLEDKGIAYIEHSVDGDDEARAKMIERAGGRRSVPQIFINDTHVGGCDDLHDLERQGKLDALLAG